MEKRGYHCVEKPPHMLSLPGTLGGELQSSYWLTFMSVIWILKLIYQSVDDEAEERGRDDVLDGTIKI